MRIIIPYDPEFYRGRPVGYEKSGVFCGLAAPNGLHFALPQHLRSFLLLLLTSIAGMSTECKRLASGSEYAGRISRTHGGFECQSWSAQFPHQHDFRVRMISWTMQLFH